MKQIATHLVGNDLSGHRWAIDRHLRDVPADESATHVGAASA